MADVPQVDGTDASNAADPRNFVPHRTHNFGDRPLSDGLVPSTVTSDTRGVDAEFFLGSQAMRLSRMKRSIKSSARAIQEVGLAGREKCSAWLITLTYASVDGWGPRHVTEALKCVRQWGERRGYGIPYVWVAELQIRGAVHYHVILWLPHGLSMPKWDKQGWWKHGFTRTERAIKPVGYLTKYASKGDRGTFPPGLRLTGAGGLDKAARAVRAWLMLPGWLRVRLRDFQRVTRLPGGLWVGELTGECFRSPFEFVRFDQSAGGSWFRERKVELV